MDVGHDDAGEIIMLEDFISSSPGGKSFYLAANGRGKENDMFTTCLFSAAVTILLVIGLGILSARGSVRAAWFGGILLVPGAA